MKGDKMGLRLEDAIKFLLKFFLKFCLNFHKVNNKYILNNICIKINL